MRHTHTCSLIHAILLGTTKDCQQQLSSSRSPTSCVAGSAPTAMKVGPARDIFTKKCFLSFLNLERERERELQKQVDRKGGGDREQFSNFFFSLYRSRKTHDKQMKRIEWQERSPIVCSPIWHSPQLEKGKNAQFIYFYLLSFYLFPYRTCLLTTNHFVQ